MSDYIVDMDAWTGAAEEVLHYIKGQGVTLGEMGSTNYLLQTLTWADTAWTGTSVTRTSDGTLMSDGVTSAVKLLETAVNAQHLVEQTITLATAGTYTLSVEVKGGLGRNWVWVDILGSFSGFDISTGVVGTVGAGASSAIENLGDGWYKCSVTVSLSATLNTVFVGVSYGDTDINYTGNITKGLYLGPIQLEPHNIATTHIPTTTVAVTRADARIYYAPRISNPGSLKTMMFSEGTTRGESKIGSGEVRLDNIDGALDALAGYGYGRDIMIRELLAGGLIGLTLSCSTEQPAFDLDEITIRIKDPQARLNVPLQANKYGGTNVNGEGVDGEDDIKNTPKPLAYGDVFNCTPVCVNRAKQIYQANDGAMQAISAVRDKGIPLPMDTAYASQAALEAAAPPPGYYACHLASGLFRLGSAPQGALTFDGLQGANAAARTVAQIAKQIALRTLSAGDLVDADFTALDSLNSAVIGRYWREETTVIAALDEVVNSIGAWAAFDHNLKLNVGQLVAPAGTADIELTTAHIQQMQRITPQDAGRGVPAWKINLGYRKNHTIQDAGSLGGEVSGTPWRVDLATGLGSFTSGDFRAIAFGNGLFAAAGYNDSRGVISVDGKAWTTTTLGWTRNWSGMAYGNGVFVLVNNADTKVLTSPDGITWTSRTGIMAATAIAYGNGVFVALSSGGTVAATSPDGITWTSRTVPNDNYKSVCYGAALFVATSGSAVITSPDGITWTSRTSSTAGWLSVAYGNNIFVRVSSTGDKFSTSPNAITWTDGTFPVRGNGNYYSVVFGDGQFVALQYNGGYTATSPDGATWTMYPYDSTYQFPAMAFGNGKFVSLQAARYLLRQTNVDSLLAQLYGREYQTVTDDDADIKTPYPNAPVLEYTSLIAVEADAQAEVERQFAIRSVRSDFYAVTIPRQALATMPMFNQLVNVTYPRYGCDSGKKFVLMGYNLELETDELTLYIWRPDV